MKHRNLQPVAGKGLGRLIKKAAVLAMSISLFLAPPAFADWQNEAAGPGAAGSPAAADVWAADTLSLTSHGRAVGDGGMLLVGAGGAVGVLPFADEGGPAWADAVAAENW